MSACEFCGGSHDPLAHQHTREQMDAWLDRQVANAPPVTPESMRAALNAIMGAGVAEVSDAALTSALLADRMIRTGSVLPSRNQGAR